MCIAVLSQAAWVIIAVRDIKVRVDLCLRRRVTCDGGGLAGWNFDAGKPVPQPDDWRSFMLPVSCLMPLPPSVDRKSTRLNSSHTVISYAVFCLKKKNINKQQFYCTRGD